MARRSFVALFCAFAFGLAACGSDGDSGGGGTTNPDFVGHWTGTWNSSGALGAQNGTADVTIGSSGQLLGTLANATLSDSASVKGSIDQHGNASGTYSYSNGFSANFGGTFVLQQNGQLGGSFEISENGQSVGTGSVTLTKQ